MPAVDLELAPARRGSGPDPARGLALARRIERTNGLVRQARRRVKRTEAKGRKRAAKQLERLRDVLAGVERDSIALGVTPSFAHQASEILTMADEHLEAALAHKRLKKRHLKALRQQIRAERRRLEALLTELMVGSGPREVPSAEDAPTG